MIWVADDNPAVVESLVLLLKASGMEAFGINSSQEVISRLQAGERPAVLVLDLQMPYDGTVVLQKVLKDTPESPFPIIVLSGYGDDLEKKLADRVVAILSKTDNPSVLVARIREIRKNKVT